MIKYVFKSNKNAIFVKIRLEKKMRIFVALSHDGRTTSITDVSDI